MPVTNYYTVDGHLIGYDDGSQKDFLTDTLGSVTAEIDHTGVTKVFDGRYQPYGGELTSNGTRGNYGWIGTWGYRETGLTASSHYVRARHYSITSSAWSSWDPLWPGETPYAYLANCTTAVDPTGRCAIKVNKAYYEPSECSANCNAIKGSEQKDCQWRLQSKALIDWSSNCNNCGVYQWVDRYDGKGFVHDDALGWPYKPDDPFRDYPHNVGSSTTCINLTHKRKFVVCICCDGAQQCWNWKIDYSFSCCTKPKCSPARRTSLVGLNKASSKTWCKKI